MIRAHYFPPTLKHRLTFILCLPLVSVLLYSNISFAAPIQCSDILQVSHEAITTNFSEATSRSTVEITNEINGSHGGKLLVLHKSGETWVSQFITFHFDLQGDPRWFIGSVGENVAAFFGFRIIDTQTMTIPNATEFQNALDKVNKVLIAEGKEPVSIRFKTDDLESSPMQGYIDTFRTLQLPLASDGNHLVHDMSFHTGTIFIPNRIIDAAEKRVSFSTDFMSFLAKRKGEHSELIDSINKYVKALLVRSIDNGTGFGNLAMIAFKTSDALIESQITELIDKMHDSEVEGSSVDISLLAPLHLSVGTISPMKHYQNPRFIYNPPNPSSSGLRLKDYTLDMITQFLDTAINIKHERQQRDRARAHASGLRSFNPDVLKVELAKFLQEEMEAFSRTPEGRHSNFNLLTIFDKDIALKGSQRGFEMNSRIADDLALEFTNRALEVENAAAKYILDTNFSAPLLLTNPVVQTPE